MASIEGLLRWPLTDVVCRGSCPPIPRIGFISLNASITTLPLTDWMGSITTATHLGFSCSKDCYVGPKVPAYWYPRWRASSRRKGGSGTTPQPPRSAGSAWACRACPAGRPGPPIPRWLTCLIAALRTRPLLGWRSRRSPTRSAAPSLPGAPLLARASAFSAGPGMRWRFVPMCLVCLWLRGCLGSCPFRQVLPSRPVLPC